MGFSYLRSKLSIFLNSQTLCSNKIVSHDQGFLRNIINGGRFKLQRPRTQKNPLNLLKYVSRVCVFSSVLFFSSAKHTNSRLLLASRSLVTGTNRYLVELSKLPWQQWLQNPRLVLVGLCVWIAVSFGRLERIPYSRRYHFVLSCNMLERKIGKFMFKNIVEYYKKSILPPSSAKSIRVQSILGEIVHAMHNGLRLEKNCNVNMCSSENPQVIMAVDGSGQQQHDSEVRVEKLGNENDVKRIGKLGRRFATKHLDGLNWEVMLVDSSYTKNAYYIPEGRIVVFTGLLDCLQSDAELATILAHEVGHGIAQHAQEHFMKLAWILALLLLIPFPLDPKFTLKLYEILFSFISRRMEFEADYIGLMLMASAGYDPQEAPKVYEVRLGDEDRGLSATHPSGSKRAEKLNKPKVMQKAVAIYKEVRSGQGVTSFI
ncbi:unnamed protein product [Camellia sinensis]